MANLKKILWDAHALSEFANLEPDGVRHFQQKYPDLVPQAWWNYQAKGSEEKQWQMTQRFLRDSWQKGFTGGVFSVMRLVLSVFNPDDLLDSLFGFKVDRPAFANIAVGEVLDSYTPFQKAVLFIFEHPWRARFCPVCNKRFVAAEAKTKFCSQQCSDESTRRRHLEWARKNLKAWRKKQKAKMKSRGGT